MAGCRLWQTLLIINMCFSFGNTTWLHNITISKDGKDDTTCLQDGGNPCLTIQYALRGLLENKSANYTLLVIRPGSYEINSSFTFRYTKQFAIIGAAGAQEVTVNCGALSGLSFINSKDLIFQNVTFSTCGAPQNSTTRNNPQFLAGIFMVNCINVAMRYVWVTDSPGIGVQLYDVTGDVLFENSHFHKNGNQTTENELVNAGGGLYLEHTFNGGLWPFEKPTDITYQQNGTFNFVNSTFDDNIASYPNINNSVSVPNATDHVAFGRGGGISMFLKGQSQNNKFQFDHCRFSSNYALFGGGFFVETQDKAKQNNIVLTDVSFNNNTAAYGGGAVRAGLITIQKNYDYIPSTIQFEQCYFKQNKAIFGGAFSLYGTTKSAYSMFPANRYINFSLCVFEENLATMGSAFAQSLWNVVNIFSIGTGLPVIIFLKDCNFTRNWIILTEDKQVFGSGSLYSNGMPLVLDNVKFIGNNGTALVLDNAAVKIQQHVLFQNNSGQNGGGVALYGVSKLDIAREAHLIFIRNKCYEKGGAMYVHTPGPQLVAFETTELNTHGCFFRSSDSHDGFVPDQWAFNVTFVGNKAPFDAAGHSIFATTLQYCRQADQGRINNFTMQWKSFNYFTTEGVRSNMKYEIVTNAVEMKIDPAEWNVTTDKLFSPTLQLIDEKNNTVYGIIDIELTSRENVSLQPPFAYHLAKDRIESLKIEGVPKTVYDVHLSTVGSQLLSKDIFNAQIGICSAGYKSENNVCVCDRDNIGISRCEEKNQSVLLIRGFWGGYVKDKEDGVVFVTVPCPHNYCHCNTETSLLSEGECLFTFETQCSRNRQGQVCGECKKNFSLKVGEDGCVDDCETGWTWLGSLVGLILFLTVLVVVVIIINFDPFSAYLNAWLYSYQVMLFLVPYGITLDPFLLFTIGLANVRLLGFGGFCMWSHMDDLQKLAFNYLFPVYVMLCLYLLYRLARVCNNRLTRYLTQTSTARAFCTLFVLSYSTITYVSLNILYPVKVGREHFVFYQATVRYFSSYHVAFAIPAMLLLLSVGILFPVMLIRRQWFRCIDSGLILLLLDNFQNPFRRGYEWFAGFYFVCRFALMLISSTVYNVNLANGLQQCICVVILTAFALCKPYRESTDFIPLQILNVTDLVLLCNLCVLTSFSSLLSGTFVTGRFKSYDVFVDLIEISGYIPLALFLLFLVYFLFKYYRYRRNYVPL